MIKIVDQVAPGYIIQIPNNNKRWEIKMLEFVNDKKIC